MKRGFKTWAEKKSITIREELDLKRFDPLPMRSLSKHLGVIVSKPSSIPGLTVQHVAKLKGTSISGWSALCIPVQTGHVVIYNENHTAARQESDLAHELSHIICKHRPEEFVELTGGVRFLRGYNSDQEDEAKWLGGCLQLPKEALIKELFSKQSDDNIAFKFGASLPMVQYRKRISGAQHIVNRSVSHSRR